jgi:hypothetical protein
MLKCNDKKNESGQLVNKKTNPVINYIPKGKKMKN